VGISGSHVKPKGGEKERRDGQGRCRLVWLGGSSLRLQSLRLWYSENQIEEVTEANN
jgi:hypothetical protein